MDFTKYKQAYLCGDMLHKSLFEYRQKRKDSDWKDMKVLKYTTLVQIKILITKRRLKHELAGRKCQQDTQAIEKADIYIIELPTADAGGRGTVADGAGF